MPTTLISFGNGVNFADPITATVDVGTGSDRAAYVMLGRMNSSTPIPSAVTVGTDTLTAQGSTEVDVQGRSWRLFAGFLTVTGSQTVSGDYTTGDGLATMSGCVVSGVGAGLISGLVWDASTSNSDPPSFTIASASGDRVYAFFSDVAFSNRTLTATAPATALTGTGIGDATNRYGLEEDGAASVVIDGSFSSTATWRGFGFSVPGIPGAPVITGPSGKQMTGGFFDLSGGMS